MKIMLAAAGFSSEMTGVQRHGFNVVRCLLAQPEISSVHLVVAPWQRMLVQSFGFRQDERLKIHIAAMDRGSVGRNLWYARALPLLAAQEAVDLVHLAYPVPMLSRAYLAPVVVSLHDLYPYEIPRNFGFSKALFNRIILRECLHSANGIACVSQITLQRLGEYLPSMQRKAVRIFNSVMPPQAVAGQPPVFGWEEMPFLLCVAQHRRNKNIPLLLQIFAELLESRRIDSEMKLLVVGIRGPETQHIQHAIKRYRLQNRVMLLDGLSEAELQWCYSRCEALVAPSGTEGFGLPIAEALLAGCRIICSEIPAFCEVGEGHCRFVPLGKGAVRQFANAIADELAYPRPAPLALSHLSVKELGAQYIAYYRHLIAATPSVACLQARTAERLSG
jgi:glycosyltransferase involved in cell wall biosynthesis